jgi:hypothetical protein
VDEHTKTDMTTINTQDPNTIPNSATDRIESFLNVLHKWSASPPTVADEPTEHIGGSTRRRARARARTTRRTRCRQRLTIDRPKRRHRHTVRSSQLARLERKMNAYLATPHR